MLTVPQSTTERVLEAHLEAAGVAVERGVRLDGLRQSDGTVQVTLRTMAGSGGSGEPAELRTYDWVLGCDGAGSTVRQQIGLAFPGSSSRSASAIADLELDLPYPDDEVHLVLRHGGGVHVLPMADAGCRRVLLDHWPGSSGATPDPAELVAIVGDRLGLGQLDPSGVRWASTSGPSGRPDLGTRVARYSCVAVHLAVRCAQRRFARFGGLEGVSPWRSWRTPGSSNGEPKRVTLRATGTSSPAGLST